jgi:hypothetical protein
MKSEMKSEMKSKENQAEPRKNSENSRGERQHVMHDQVRPNEAPGQKKSQDKVRTTP